ncbi:MAG: hypothetical protein J7M18_05910, partial [Candidatus Eremiobacteraeota bacterium]|nr:hypothetical protein [Candidatus Eremiobacteraeota bacterium]
MYSLGIRREDKSKWERRVPLNPADVKKLIEKHGIHIVIQPSNIRIYSDQEYLDAKAEINEDLSSCQVIMGIKEMPSSFFLPGKTYIFFSHTIKGQEHNMPMLKKMMELGCTLIDYEKITDTQGRRLVFFGRHAGQAGMIDTLWALGKRLEWEGFDTPFSEIHRAYQYEGVDDAKKAISITGKLLGQAPLPEKLRPMIFGFAGYGNVSQGAQEIFDVLPTTEIKPGEIKSLAMSDDPPGDRLFKVIFY